MQAETNAPVTLEFFAEPEHLVDVRRLVERLGSKTTLSREQLSDLLTAVDEATANAIRYGSPNGDRSLVKVICHPLTSGLIVEVRDNGGGFAVPLASKMPAPDALGGRGLPLMVALADSIEIASTGKGTTVTLKKLSNR
jgi:anti-sigma regulatory factor (Ser/Thr protein kinase)